MGRRGWTKITGGTAALPRICSTPDVGYVFLQVGSLLIPLVFDFLSWKNSPPSLFGYTFLGDAKKVFVIKR